VLAACGSDNSSRSDGGEIFGRRPAGSAGSAGGAPASSASGSSGSASSAALLSAPAGTDPATIAAAADVVRARLGRMGVADAVVTARADGVAVQSSADAYQLHAAAQQHATTVAPITATALGPCGGPGIPSTGAAARCYTLGPALSAVGAVTTASVVSASGAGWKILFSVDANHYQAFRSALAGGGTGPLALVADGTVVLAFGSGVPALQSAIGPPLAEDEARLAAAALAVEGDLPVALQAPALPEAAAARIDVDFWTAAIGAKVCGTWLPNAPAAGLETGVHSHGDGLVYVHPFHDDEAGDKATLGLFLDRGGWKASADRLQLWDGVEHRAGATCPDGRVAQVRWWVDGVEQHGDPAAFLPRNGQVIVLSFDADPAAPGAPPQMAALYLPSVGAATS